ncbi:MAG: sulfite exporter TauE/SafE family protein [Simkaniaceae bacterium]|nr:sulfite exporter TauE/SafE family protein [Simkaniaceae bacterium]
MIWILAFILIGICAGLCSGLFGFGGGIVTVPALLVIFTWMGMPANSIMHIAIATSLSSMIFNTASATYKHSTHGSVLWRLLIPMGFGIIIGAIIGPQIAKLLSSHVLKIIFGFLEIIIGGLLFFSRAHIVSNFTTLPTKTPLFLLGFFNSLISSLIGIAGGLFVVPFLIAYKIPLQKAIGTSAASGLIITIVGTLAYLFSIQKGGFSEGLGGYIYLPAFLTLSITSLIVAPVGVYLAHKLPVILIKRVLSVIIVLIGLSMVIL